jgi:hypothetical protein
MDLGTTKSNQAICGAYSVDVFTDQDGSDTAPSSSWASIVASGNTYTLDLDTTKD